MLEHMNDYKKVVSSLATFQNAKSSFNYIEKQLVELEEERANLDFDTHPELIKKINRLEKFYMDQKKSLIHLHPSLAEFGN